MELIASFQGLKLLPPSINFGPTYFAPFPWNIFPNHPFRLTHPLNAIFPQPLPSHPPKYGDLDEFNRYKAWSFRIKKIKREKLYIFV